MVDQEQQQQQQQPEQQLAPEQQQQLEPVQQQQLEPEQPLRLDQGQQYTRQRVRKLARSWEDSSSANTGLVSLTEKSQVAGAAACVAADLETNVSKLLLRAYHITAHMHTELLRSTAEGPACGE
jgi:hypothetical protein